MYIFCVKTQHPTRDYSTWLDCIKDLFKDKKQKKNFCSLLASILSGFPSPQFRFIRNRTHTNRACFHFPLNVYNFQRCFCQFIYFLYSEIKQNIKNCFSFAEFLCDVKDILMCAHMYKHVYMHQLLF